MTSHLLDTVTEFVCSKKPADGNGLEETHPQKGQARTRIEIHQLEKIHATLKKIIRYVYELFTTSCFHEKAKFFLKIPNFPKFFNQPQQVEAVYFIVLMDATLLISNASEI